MKDEQESLLFEFTKEQFLFLELTLILTLFSTPIILWTTEDALLTLIIYITLFQIGIPFGYMIFLFKGKRAFEYYFTGELTMRKKLLTWGVIFSLLTFGLHFMLSWVYFDYFMSYSAIDLPLDFSDDMNMSLFMMIFMTFYPIFEELYWRIFIAKTFPRTEFYYILNSLHYGLLHLFVLLQLAGTGFSLICGVYFCGVGCLLIYLKRFMKLINIIMIHIAMNGGLVLGLYVFYVK